MTVKELIAQLIRHDPDAVVVVPAPKWNDLLRWKLIEEVEGDDDDRFKPDPDRPEYGSVGSSGTQKVVTIW